MLLDARKLLKKGFHRKAVDEDIGAHKLGKPVTSVMKK